MGDVKVTEWVSGPGKYVEKTYTFDELRSTFTKGELVWELMDQVERLTQENAALLADAERYRWLRGECHITGRVCVDVIVCEDRQDWSNPTTCGAPEELDAAVDAARAAGPAGEGEK